MCVDIGSRPFRWDRLTPSGDLRDFAVSGNMVVYYESKDVCKKFLMVTLSPFLRPRSVTEQKYLLMFPEVHHGDMPLGGGRAIKITLGGGAL